MQRKNLKPYINTLAKDICLLSVNQLCDHGTKIRTFYSSYAAEMCCDLTHQRRKCERCLPNFFTANIWFWEHLGVICFRPKNQSFLLEKEPATFSHGHRTHSAKVLLIVWPEIPQMPHKISAQFGCLSPKVSNFRKKAFSG